MRSRPVPAPAPDRSHLLCVSRDTLRRAAAPLTGPSGGPQSLAADLGVLSQTLDSVDRLLVSIRAELMGRAQSGALDVVDGPFTGEPAQALATMDLWVSRAVAAVEESRRAVDNAHYAVSGVATARR